MKGSCDSKVIYIILFNTGGSALCSQLNLPRLGIVCVNNAEHSGVLRGWILILKVAGEIQARSTGGIYPLSWAPSDF